MYHTEKFKFSVKDENKTNTNKNKKNNKTKQRQLQSTVMHYLHMALKKTLVGKKNYFTLWLKKF